MSVQVCEMLGFFLQKPSNSADSDRAFTNPVARRLAAGRQIVPCALDNTAALFLRPEPYKLRK